MHIIRLFIMTMIRGSRLHSSLQATTSKYPLPTFLQSFTAAILHHLFQQAPHCLYPIHQTIEFRELSL